MKAYVSLLSLVVSVGIFLTSALLADTAVTKTPAPATAAVYFISPEDGATVKSPVLIRFGLKAMGVAPAGTIKENTGHHHLLIDTELPDLNQPIAADDKHKHFGNGQTETSLELTPGKHSLQLLLGDHFHIPHQPAVMSKKITIYVP